MSCAMDLTKDPLIVGFTLRGGAETRNVESASIHDGVQVMGYKDGGADPVNRDDVVASNLDGETSNKLINDR